MPEEAPKLAWTGFVPELASLLRERQISASLYVVGGAVRDAYLGRAITDIDIAVAGDALALARQVADWLDADVYVMDRERDVARVLHRWRGQRICLDFARLRGPSLEADLRDRDFTMNAMAADLLGELEVLIDPHGGAADLRQKVLRRCSQRAIHNDPLRALRAVRLSAQFALKIHPETTADIRAGASGLRRCSGERIRDEFFKMLALDKPARALRVCLHLGLLKEILGDAEVHNADWAANFALVVRMSGILTAIGSRRTDNTAAAFDLGMLVIQLDRFRASLQAHIGREYGGARQHGELLILAALLQDQADLDVSRLKLSAEEDRSLRLAITQISRFAAQSNWGALERHRYWHDLKRGGIDLILLALAQYLAVNGNTLRQADWLMQVDNATRLLDVYFNRYDEMVEPPMLLNGNEIRAQLDLPPGPKIGRILRALREAQATKQVTTKREARDFVSRQREASQD